MNLKESDSFIALERVLERLSEALAEDSIENPLAIDGTIQRFEFAIELFWKVLKKYLAQEGINVKSPKDALKEAFSIDLLEDEETWLQMISDRNETSHTYNDEIAQKIYSHIDSYHQEMSKVYQILKNKK